MKPWRTLGFDLRQRPTKDVFSREVIGPLRTRDDGRGPERRLLLQGGIAPTGENLCGKGGLTGTPGRFCAGAADRFGGLILFSVI
jgi:hypothetical protein